ncbi:hypothetical protein RHMOL_Rhmol09G0018200 [Rhododendron molle]|nr:hypothetical protein RHMOL_Rhmol09G0018200 [Rhododendron molle]
MDRTKIDVDMWSYANEEIFLKILIDESSKEQSVNTRKTKTFNTHQWTSIHKEFTRQVPRVGYSITKMQQKLERLKAPYRSFCQLKKVHTGLGWDAELQTVTAPPGVWDEIIKANSKYAKLRNKGIDHFELLDELLHNSMATGAFAQPGTRGAATSDEERAMFGPPKSIRGGDSMYTDSRKRKSDGSGGSVMKQVRGEQIHAYESMALANERKAGYYEALTINRQQSVTPQFTIKETIAALDDIQEIVGDTQYWKAYALMMGPEGPTWREGFMNHQSHNRIGMRGKKFYVVFVGRNPGIYDSWAACSDQVIRFPGAVHNKFASWDEAYNAWLAYTGQVQQLVPPPVLPSLDDAAGSSSEYTPTGRVSFPLWLILAMTFCFIVVVATVIFYLF